MAEKTEKPTQLRLRRLQQAGIGPRSRLLTKAAGFTSAVALLPHLATITATHLQKNLRLVISTKDTLNVVQLALAMALEMLTTLAAFFAVIVAASLIVHLAQAGHLALRMPSLQALGRKKSLSSQLLQRRFWLSAGIRIALVIAAWVIVFYLVFRGAITLLPQANSLSHLYNTWFSLAHRALWLFAFGCLIAATLDYLSQYLAYRRDSRMTQSEARDEWREQVGSREVIAQRKQLHLEILGSRINELIPSTAVIIEDGEAVAILIAHLPRLFAAPRLLKMAVGQEREEALCLAVSSGVPVIASAWLTAELRSLPPAAELPPWIEPHLQRLLESRANGKTDAMA